MISRILSLGCGPFCQSVGSQKVVRNLNAILTSLATPWVWLYGLIKFVIQQTRLSTATTDWLDLIAFDFYGSKLGRKPNEGDLIYRGRIQAALLREAATRSAVSSGLEELLGTQPSIFEPGSCGDAGSYGSLSSGLPTPGTGMAYGRHGGWGNLTLPYQFFITVTRPATPGVGMLAGYGTPQGGYGAGAIGYLDLSLLPGHVTDEDVQTTLCSLLPINTVAWMRIH